MPDSCSFETKADAVQSQGICTVKVEDIYDFNSNEILVIRIVFFNLPPEILTNKRYFSKCFYQKKIVQSI